MNREPNVLVLHSITEAVNYTTYYRNEKRIKYTYKIRNNNIVFYDPNGEQLFVISKSDQGFIRIVKNQYSIMQIEIRRKRGETAYENIKLENPDMLLIYHLCKKVCTKGKAYEVNKCLDLKCEDNYKKVSEIIEKNILTPQMQKLPWDLKKTLIDTYLDME